MFLENGLETCLEGSDRVEFKVWSKFGSPPKTGVR
jgi:hypothetical protein